MDIEPILAAIDGMGAAERQRVRAHLEVLDGGQAADPVVRYADSDEVRQAAEFLNRFPESVRRLAGT